MFWEWLAIFTYEFKKASDGFAAENVPLNTLSNYSVLVDTAVEYRLYWSGRG